MQLSPLAPIPAANLCRTKVLYLLPSVSMGPQTVALDGPAAHSQNFVRSRTSSHRASMFLKVVNLAHTDSRPFSLRYVHQSMTISTVPMLSLEDTVARATGGHAMQADPMLGLPLRQSTHAEVRMVPVMLQRTQGNSSSHVSSRV